jgi:amino acid adenylation domain-containing protein
MNLPYLRSHGGANLSNRSLAENLAARGHQIRVVVPALATPSSCTMDDYLSALTKSGLQPKTESGCDLLRVNDVDLVNVRIAAHLRQVLVEQIDGFQPDWTFVSSEDQSQSLLAAALDRRPTRIIYLAHTPQMLPFGPASLYPGSSRTEMIRCVAGIVTISRYVAEYVERWVGRKALVNHPPHFGPGPFPDFGSQPSEAVLLLNACAVKGISIFLALARAFPRFQFAAVPGYGTTPADRRAMAQQANVSVLENAEDLDQILSRARVLLMPSLWVEGFGKAAVDAMLRGIPVLASDFGGLREAALGTASLLPVNPIQTFGPALDEALLPQAVIPEQDLAPWQASLERLMLDTGYYRERSLQARSAALEFVRQLSCEPLEQFLSDLAGVQVSPPHALPAASESTIDSRLKQLSPEQRALFILRLNKTLRSQSAADIPLCRYERPSRIPLSFAQRRLWVLEQIAPGSTINNVTAGFRLTGSLDKQALRSTLGEIVRRHESLRTCFPSDFDKPYQHISPVAGLDIQEVSLGPGRERQVDKICRLEAETPFDVARGPLFRARLVRLSETEHILLVAMHHIVTDGWSMKVLASEFAEIYQAYRQGRRSPLPELEIQYADFALWQHERIKAGLLKRQIDHWKTKLAGLIPVRLPEDFPRPTLPTNRGGQVPILVPASTTRSLNELSSREGSTLFMALLAALDLLLFRCTGATDIAVGTVTASRTHTQLESLVGFFVNTLVLRTDLSGPLTFRELLRKVKSTVLEAQQNQDLPYEILLNELAPSRSLDNSPFFQTVLVLQNGSAEKCEVEALRIEHLDLDDRHAKFDLMLAITETPEGLQGGLSFARELFEQWSMDRFAAQFTGVLAAVADNPDLDIARVTLLAPREERLLIEDWAGREDEIPRDTIVDLLDAQARKTPQAVAVVSGDHVYTYRELHSRANRLARELQKMGVGPELRVGICLRRSAEMVVALLAVLKAGGAYVPLDPDYPEERLRYILADSAPALLVTEMRLAQRFPECSAPVLELDSAWAKISGVSEKALRTTIAPNNAAYVLYTSGSTGRPKGVVIEHRGTVALLKWALQTYSAQELEAVLFSTSLCFDLSVFELFAPLVRGGKVVVSPNLLAWEGGTVSLINSVPSVVAEWSRNAEFQTVPVVINLAGEPLPRWLADRLYAGKGPLRIMNLYGPTECTTYSTFADVEREQTPHVGKPIHNTRVYVLDEWHELAPIGVAGELYIGGAGVARGYWQRPSLTAERFVPDRFGGERGQRLYRTGDLVRWRRDGTLEYLGRMDHQVKIHGFRIELGEIESVLCTHPQVDRAAVIVREDTPGHKRLVAYITPRGQDQAAGQALLDFLRVRLPAHMTPAAFVQLTELPVSPNGKLDRKALPAPCTEPSSSVRAPGDEWEQRLVQIWSEVLDRTEVGPTQDFFAIGGNSLNAIQVAVRLAREFHRDVPVGVIFEHPTIEQQASFLRGNASLDLAPSLVPIHKSGERTPLFFVHPHFGLAHCYLELAGLLGPELPFYGLQAQGVEEGQALIPTIPKMAALYLKSVRTIQPHGPYRLGGWSMGSSVAYEMACQLLTAGESVSFLAFVDGRPVLPQKLPLHLRVLSRDALMATLRRECLIALAVSAGLPEPEMRSLPAQQRAAWFLERSRGRGRLPVTLSPAGLERVLRVVANNQIAQDAYEPDPCPVAAVLVRTPIRGAEEASYGWSRLALGGVRVIEVEGTHDDLMIPPAVTAVAEAIKPILEASDWPDAPEPLAFASVEARP